MFDIGFSELLVIAVVALLVIGPERLPKVARTAGIMFGRLQRYVNDVKADIQREVELDELKKLRSQFEDAAKSVEQSVSEVDQQMRAVGDDLNRSIGDPAAGGSTGPDTASALPPPADSGAPAKTSSEAKV
ncbi:MAG TPA: Sec-independent protein translocase protein TatB [Burkholderiales bacterium]|nr:Sec-independent protein translocase protein TatB [Burkholderiales bacterium]